MERIDLIDLDLVYLISDEMSLDAVAQKMRITGTAVSQRLKKMERITKRKLVNRPGPMSLTDAGERLLKVSKAMRREFIELHADLSDVQQNAKPLKIMANTSVIINDLPLIIDKMKKEYAEIEIFLLNGTLAETAKGVLAGDIDIGIMIGRQKIPGLHFLPYRKERICIFAPESHAIAQLDQTNFRTAVDHLLIGTDSTTRLAAIIEDVALQHGTPIKYAMRVTDYEAQANLIATTNAGIGFVFESVAKRFEFNFPVKIISLAETWAELDLVMCVRDVKNMSESAKDFARLVRQRFKHS